MHAMCHILLDFLFLCYTVSIVKLLLYLTCIYIPATITQSAQTTIPLYQP